MPKATVLHPHPTQLPRAVPGVVDTSAEINLSVGKSAPAIISRQTTTGIGPSSMLYTSSVNAKVTTAVHAVGKELRKSSEWRVVSLNFHVP